MCGAQRRGDNRWRWIQQTCQHLYGWDSCWRNLYAVFLPWSHEGWLAEGEVCWGMLLRAPCQHCSSTSSSVSAAVLHSEKEFHDAAKRNDTARMEELIKRGVDIKAKNNVSPRFSCLQAAESAECVWELQLCYAALLISCSIGQSFKVHGPVPNRTCGNWAVSQHTWKPQKWHAGQTERLQSLTKGSNLWFCLEPVMSLSTEQGERGCGQRKLHRFGSSRRVVKMHAFCIHKLWLAPLFSSRQTELPCTGPQELDMWMLCDCSWTMMYRWMMRTVYEGKHPLLILQMCALLGVLGWLRLNFSFEWMAQGTVVPEKLWLLCKGVVAFWS